MGGANRVVQTGVSGVSVSYRDITKQTTVGTVQQNVIGTLIPRKVLKYSEITGASLVPSESPTGDRACKIRVVLPREPNSI
ncbi:uncharacterized protein ARMOST_12462 [Armillaria ostoyae]|uniref:Uncharacterized protein n=1 Tax=Armillaria ostoyae TaxID=47428 RepID=A0A284RK06_ARMOS|nr:uncharacterized protein ARMOST_12462 [Armillaria ostoyae]